MCSVFDCPGKIMSHQDRRRSLRGCSLLERWGTGLYSWPEGSIPVWWGEGRRRPQLARSCPRTYSWTRLNVRNIPCQLGLTMSFSSPPPWRTCSWQHEYVFTDHESLSDKFFVLERASVRVPLYSGHFDYLVPINTSIVLISFWSIYCKGNIDNFSSNTFTWIFEMIWPRYSS